MLRGELSQKGIREAEVTVEVSKCGIKKCIGATIFDSSLFFVFFN